VHTNNRKGFTLIEILIVVAMLAILAALLFAVVGRVRENGRRAVCLSNVKQMSLGLLQYLQDNDSRFPIVPLPEVALRSYVKADKVFKCPSVPPQYSGQYLIPQWLLEGTVKARSIKGRHEATIANMSTTMSIFEIIGMMKNIKRLRVVARLTIRLECDTSAGPTTLLPMAMWNGCLLPSSPRFFVRHSFRLCRLQISLR
jgi:prepilin-type N-terminal cleavage/methylation domain-containing protein